MVNYDVKESDKGLQKVDEEKNNIIYIALPLEVCM